MRALFHVLVSEQPRDRQVLNRDVTFIRARVSLVVDLSLPVTMEGWSVSEVQNSPFTA